MDESKTTVGGAGVGVGQHRDRTVLRVPTMERVLRSIFPDDAVDHMKAARREDLLTLRALLDASIRRLEPREPEPRSRHVDIVVE